MKSEAAAPIVFVVDDNDLVRAAIRRSWQWQIAMVSPCLSVSKALRLTAESNRRQRYDSDKLDEELSRYGIELIAPHCSNRKNRTQDLRRLRRYRRRWKVERLLAWLQNFRRLASRHWTDPALALILFGSCFIITRLLFASSIKFRADIPKAVAPID